ncbi:MAG: hypothetical protein ACR2MW_03905 [Chthoniobacterales bacterium]
MSSSILLALIIRLAAAALEGVLAGRGVRERLAELWMPAYSPPFCLWLVIGAFYYTICLSFSVSCSAADRLRRRR